MAEKLQFSDLKRTGRLPSPKGVALRLLELANRDDTGAGEITRVLQGEPALAGRLLKAANSAGRSARAAVSVADAVVRLGMRSVRQLTLSFSLIENAAPRESKQFDFAGFWTRSLATGVVAERLARRGRLIVPDEAFTLGLLLDVGELALAALQPLEFDRLLERHRGGQAPRTLELERETFGFDRITLTAMLLEDWMLPAPMIAAVRARSEPDAGNRPAASRKLADLLDLAAALGERCAQPQPLAPELRTTLAGWLDGDADSPPDLAAFLEETAREWREWGALLVVKTPALSIPQLLAEGAPEGGSTATDAAGPLGALLVADAAAPQRAALAAAIVDAGFTVRGAGNRAEALELAKAQRPDAVLVNAAFALAPAGAPPIAGGGLCRELRAMFVDSPPHVLLLAPAGVRPETAAALAAGADDVVAQPLDALELAARLQVASRIAGLTRRLRLEAEALRSANAALKAANERLAEMALTDSLTGLPNRRHLMERLREAWTSTEAQKRDFAAICVDLDHFKKINDDRGHEAGDIVLERVGRVLRRTVRATDIVGRFGGEEFVVLCPGCDMQTAIRLAERIRAQLSLEEFSSADSTWRVTASVGVAGGTPAAMQDWRTLLRGADAAMFEAKRRGRNRVCA